MKTDKFTSKELRLLLICFIAYTGAYISRLNLAPVMDSLQQTFGVTSAQIGLLPTLFAIPYAAGQIFNGYLAEKMKPQYVMLLGLLGSAGVNLLFSLSQAYWMLLVLWFCNGYFQSMLWTPVVQIFDLEFREHVRDRAMFFFCITPVLGYLIAWLLSGLLTSHFSWRTAFVASGAVTALIALGCALSMRGLLTVSQTPAAAKAKSSSEPYSFGRLLTGTGLILVLLSSVVVGFVREGISNWAPKMLTDTQGIDLSGALGVLLIIPIINFFGIQLSKSAYGVLHNDVVRSNMLLFALSAVFAMLLSLFSGVNPLLCGILLAFCSAASYGLSTLLTGIVPLRYAATGHVPLVAGLIDASVYVGSALSGVLTGWLHDELGWTAVFLSWTVLGLLGIVLTRPTRRYLQNQNAEEVS